MATAKRGILSQPGLWWKHLRGRKRLFRKRERQSARRFGVLHVAARATELEGDEADKSGSKQCEAGWFRNRGNGEVDQIEM